jgi:hypothetical protein
MKSAYTYKKKMTPRAAKVNAADAIISEESAGHYTDESVAPTLSKADESSLISLYYVHLGAPHLRSGMVKGEQCQK